jgi:hypothetical protein
VLRSKKIITRTEARVSGLTRYFTGEPCPHGHIAERYTSDCVCYECKKIKRLAYLARYMKTPAGRAASVRRVARHAKTPAGKATRKRYRKTPRGRIIQRRHYTKWVNSDSPRAEQARIARSLRIRVSLAVKSDQRAGSAVRDLGCSIARFKLFIEYQFKSGMTWDNRGEWHLDHVKPLSSFDLTDRQQFLDACHYTNYQPMWAEDNIKKGADLTPPKKEILRWV